MTPRDNGWRAVPPWSDVGRIWLPWPAVSGDEMRDEALRDDILDLVTLLSEVVPVSVLAGGGHVADAALRTPAGVAALAVDQVPLYLRRHAPIFLATQDGQAVAGLSPDTGAGRLILEHSGLLALPAPPGLSGVSVSCDGGGTVLAAERALLRGGLDRETALVVLADWLGAERVVWLTTEFPDAPLPSVARYVAPGVVAAANYADNRERLRQAGLTVLEMPTPRKKPGLSYVDLVMAGGLMLVPAYGEARDETAVAVLTAALPGRRVMSQPTEGLAQALGGLGGAVAVAPKV